MIKKSCLVLTGFLLNFSSEGMEPYRPQPGYKKDVVAFTFVSPKDGTICHHEQLWNPQTQKNEWVKTVIPASQSTQQTNTQSQSSTSQSGSQPSHQGK